MRIKKIYTFLLDIKPGLRGRRPFQDAAMKIYGLYKKNIHRINIQWFTDLAGCVGGSLYGVF